MRIIERGQPEKSWPREITATCCMSLLEVEADEIKTDRDYTGGLNGYYLDCPVCGGQPEVHASIKADATRWIAQQERIRQHEK